MKAPKEKPTLPVSKGGSKKVVKGKACPGMKKSCKGCK